MSSDFTIQNCAPAWTALAISVSSADEEIIPITTPLPYSKLIFRISSIPSKEEPTMLRSTKTHSGFLSGWVCHSLNNLAASSEEEMLSKFLDKQEGNREKFEHNKELVRFHDMGSDMDDIEHSPIDANWDVVKESFNQMEFFSITNEKPWDKFVKTFDNLA